MHERISTFAAGKAYSDKPFRLRVVVVVVVVVVVIIIIIGCMMLANHD